MFQRKDFRAVVQFKAVLSYYQSFQFYSCCSKNVFCFVFPDITPCFIYKVFNYFNLLLILIN